MMSHLKLSNDSQDLSKVCRGCLDNTVQMKNMHDSGLTQDYFKVTGIEIQLSEDVSALLCGDCEETLNKCKVFKAQCQQSDVLLKDAIKKMKTDISADTHTASSITYEIDETGLTVKIVGLDAPEEKINLDCPFDLKKCRGRYSKKNHLLSHITKSHNVEDNYWIKLKYYCSHSNCSYSSHSTVSCDKYFTERKYLNQHYIKVHRPKRFCCEECDFRSATLQEYERHSKVCSCVYMCEECKTQYKTRDRFLVHLMRKHPKENTRYKNDIRINGKRCDDPKVAKSDIKSRRRSSKLVMNREIMTGNRVNYIKDDVRSRSVAEDSLSLRSESDLDTIFLGSVADIQTQTTEGLNRSHKETITSRSQSPDLSMKETQTCFCLYDSQSCRLFEGVMCSPCNLVSSETQTADLFPYASIDLA